MLLQFIRYLKNEPLNIFEEREITIFYKLIDTYARENRPIIPTNSHKYCNVCNTKRRSKLHTITYKNILFFRHYVRI